MVRIPEIAGAERARRLGEAELMAREYIAVTLDVPLLSIAVALTIERVGGVDVAARISSFGRDRPRGRVASTPPPARPRHAPAQNRRAGPRGEHDAQP